MSDRITYLMPIETTARELDYKLLLAARLKAPHRRFVFFRPDLAPALIRLTRGGVWVGQNIRARTDAADDYRRYDLLKEAGFVVCYVDEEGAVYPGHEDTWAKHVLMRLDPARLCADDVLVAWGSFQAGLWRNGSAAVRARIVDSGHPRFDLCRAPYAAVFDDETERIRRDQGRLVLINTNFASANFVGGLGGLFTRRDGYLPEDAEKRLAFVGAWQRSLTSVGEFVIMVHRLAARFPSYRFVLRPHPVEDHETYRATLAGVPNVRVRHEGGVLPWLRAADAVIHNGCTTAIESFLAGGTPVAYCPPTIGDGESWVPNLFSVRAESPRTLEQVVEAVEQARAPTCRPEPTQRRRAEALLAQLGEQSGATAAFDAVAGALRDAEGPLQRRRPSFRESAVRLVAEAHGAGASAKRLAREAQRWAGSATTLPTKFQSFCSAGMAARCRRIAAVTGQELEARVLSSTACVAW